MNTRKIYLSGMLLTLLLAGCGNKETHTGEIENDGRVALQVSSGIRTRAVDNRWEDNDAIGIFMLTSGGTQFTYGNSQYVVTAAGENGTFNPASDGEIIYLPEDGSSRDFVAYYPYASNMTDAIYHIDVSDQTNPATIDFMLAEKATDINRNNAKVAFKFRHKLSKVILSIKTGNGFSGDQNPLASLASVKLTGQQTTGEYFVPGGGAVTITPGSADISLKINKADVENCTAEGIVFPGNSYTGMAFRFDMGGYGQYEWELSKSEKSRKFEEGKQYEYTITINKSNIEVTSSITPWGPGNEGGENGSAE